MSLVNKVLRDLDARRAGEGERAALPLAVTPLGVRLERPRRWPWIGAVVIAVAAILGMGLPYLQGRGPSPSQAPSPPQVPGTAPAPSDNPVPAAVPGAVPAAATASLPSAVAGPPEGTAAPAPAVEAGPKEGAASMGAPGLRLSDELGRVPERRQRPIAAVSPKAADKPAQSKPAPETKAAAPTREVVPPADLAARVQEPKVDVRVEKQEHRPTPAEISDTHYRRGVTAQRQGNAAQAASFYRQALETHAEHAAARQALVATLLEARQFEEAESLLRQGTEIPAARMASAMGLARLKVEKGDAAAALDLLLRHAAAGERSAEYQGFAGALLNRAGRTTEAIERYQSATRIAPAEARWWAGLGISLDAGGRTSEAREAFLRARGLPGLPADLAQLVEQRLR